MKTRPRVVALLYVTYLAGMAISALIVGYLLRDFSELTLIRVVQGCAVVTLALNIVALWKQEHVRPMTRAERAAPQPSFRDAWNDYIKGGQAGRLLAVVFVGGLAFNMQDVLLEPYGGDVLGLSVAATTTLTAVWAVGALIGFFVGRARVGARCRPVPAGRTGPVCSASWPFPPSSSQARCNLRRCSFAGAFGIGLGLGLFAVTTLTAAMEMPRRGGVGGGLALGAWGAAQATAAGLATIIGGGLRDTVQTLADAGHLGAGLMTPDIGYSVVYHLEIGLLFLTLIILGPLVRTRIVTTEPRNQRIGLADFPT